MSDLFEEGDGIECPNCGFTQTMESRHRENHWFCFLCGTLWNPEEEEPDEDLI